MIWKYGLFELLNNKRSIHFLKFMNKFHKKRVQNGKNMLLSI